MAERVNNNPQGLQDELRSENYERVENGEVYELVVPEYDLKDFLEPHLPVTSSNFIGEISSRREFVEKRSYVNEPRPPPGESYNHQSFTHRLLRQVDRLFVNDDPGTGKTCSVLRFIDYALGQNRRRDGGLDHDEKVSNINRAFLLVSGTAQGENLRQQLACTCTVDVYDVKEDDEINPKRRDPSIKAIVDRNIRRAGYSIMRYGQFRKLLSNKFGDDYERMGAFLKNSVIFIDEMHNLIPSTITGTGQESDKDKTVAYNFYYSVFQQADRAKIIGASATPLVNFPGEIAYFFNLLLPRDGVIPLNIDPYSLNEEELSIYFPDQGLTPENIQEFSREDLDAFFVGKLNPKLPYDNPTEEVYRELNVRLRGMITYVRYADENTMLMNMENDLGEKMLADYASSVMEGENLDVVSQYESFWGTQMSKFQSKSFWRSVFKPTSDVYSAESTAANFTFPDGVSSEGSTAEMIELRSLLRKDESHRRGDRSKPITSAERLRVVELKRIVETQSVSGFHKYVRTVSTNVYAPTEEFRELLDDKENIRQYSAKYYDMCEIFDQSPGICYDFQKYIRTGIVLLGFCLESAAYGFENYSGRNSAFSEGENILRRSYCSGSDYAGARTIKLEKRKRYAVIDVHSTGANITNILQLLNSPENALGEYLKVIIVSGAGKEGINIYNAVTVVIGDSVWTTSDHRQAVSRTTRSNGRNELLAQVRDPEVRKRLGVSMDYDFRPIRVYNMASMPIPWESYNKSEQAEILINHDGNQLYYNEDSHYRMQYGPEMYFYLYARKKDMAIAPLRRYMKMISVGCLVHYERNRISSEYDGTPLCDYDKCNYECQGKPLRNADGSLVYEEDSYNLIFGQDRVLGLVRRIEELYRYKSSFTLQELMKQLQRDYNLHHNDHYAIVPDYRILVRALHRIISRKLSIRDGFGRMGYVREEGQFLRWIPFSNSGTEAGQLVLEQSLLLQDRLKENSAPLAMETVRALQDVLKRGGNEGEEVIKGLTHSQYNELTDILAAESIEVQRLVFEHFSEQFILNGGRVRSVLQRYILHMYYFIFYSVPFQSDVTSSRPGRRPGIKSRVPDKPRKDVLDEARIKIAQQEKEGAHKVYVHIMDSLARGQAQYGQTDYILKAGGVVRVFDSKRDNHWRDLSGAESSKYISLIQARIADRTAKYSINDHYILRTAIGTPYIEGPDVTQNTTQGRSRMCKDNPPIRSVDIARKMGLDPPRPVEEYSRSYLLEELTQKLNNPRIPIDITQSSTDELAYYYAWLRNLTNRMKRTQPKLCNHIVRSAMEKGALVDFMTNKDRWITYIK